MPQRYRVLAMLFALVVIMYLDRLCIALAGPRIQKELGLQPSSWGWVLGIFTISYALFEVPGGMLADRIGPRKVLTRIVLWWSVFTALTGVVTGFGMLLVVRFLFGAGEAGTFPNCASVVSRWFPPQERARSSSAFWVATAVGGAITPLLVIPIQQAYGWRLAFGLFGSLGLFWAGFWFWWFRDQPGEKAGITQAELAHIGNLTPPKHTLVPWRTALRSRNFRLLLAMYHCYCWGTYFFLSWLPVYLQVGRGLTENQMKIASSLPSWFSGLGILVGGFLSDRLAKRYSLRVARCSIGAVSLIGAGLNLIAATQTRNNRVAVGLITVGVGMLGMMLPVSWSVCLDIGREYAGALSGAMNMSGQIGSFLSSVAFGYLVQWTHNYDLSLLPLAMLLVVSGCLFAMIDPAQRIIPET